MNEDQARRIAVETYRPGRGMAYNVARFLLLAYRQGYDLDVHPYEAINAVEEAKKRHARRADRLRAERARTDRLPLPERLYPVQHRIAVSIWEREGRPSTKPIPYL